MGRTSCSTTTPAGLGEFVRSGSGGDIDRLIQPAFEFGKIQRAVVQRRREPESVLYQDFLARPVAEIHSAHLRDRGMAFIHEQHPLAWDIVQQCRGRFPWTPSCQMARIVFDPAAISQFFHHLEIEHGPLVQPARFQEFILLFQAGSAFLQLRFDAANGVQQLFPGLDVMGFRIDGHSVVLFQNASGDRIDLGDGIDFVAEHLNAHRIILIGRKYLYDVAPCPEESPLKAIVLPGKLHFNQAPQDLIALDVLPFFQKEKHPVIGFRRTQTVDARNAGDDDAILALKQRPRCGVAQPVDLIVDQRILFDVGVRGRDVGFRLIVIVVGHKIFDRIFGKE